MQIIATTTSSTNILIFSSTVQSLESNSISRISGNDFESLYIRNSSKIDTVLRNVSLASIVVSLVCAHSDSRSICDNDHIGTSRNRGCILEKSPVVINGIKLGCPCTIFLKVDTETFYLCPIKSLCSGNGILIRSFRCLNRYSSRIGVRSDNHINLLRIGNTGRITDSKICNVSGNSSLSITVGKIKGCQVACIYSR